MKRSLIIAWIVLFPVGAQAAVMSFDPSSGSFNRGDEFAVAVRIDIGSSCINAVEAGIDFAGSQARLVDFSTGDSILSLWVERPSTEDMERINTEGKLYLSGGIPGGFCGKIPGDPGPSNLLATLYFRIPGFSVNGGGDEGLALAFDPASTTAYRNDGLGTAEELVLKAAQFSFAPTTGLPDSQWQDRIKADTIPPEPFVVELQRSDELFEGRYFINFTTTDKQTGVDHYEVIELRPGETAGRERPPTIIDRILRHQSIVPNWRIAAMPYVLEDQELMSVIKVRAIDKSGNERLVEYIPPEPIRKAAQSSSPAWFVLLLLIIAAVVLSIIAAKIFKKKGGSRPGSDTNRPEPDQGGSHDENSHT